MIEGEIIWYILNRFYFVKNFQKSEIILAILD